MLFICMVFASSPQSRKAQDIGELLSDDCTSYTIPALDGGDFPSLTWERMVTVARQSLADLPVGEPCTIIGSSLGGYLATWLVTEKIPELANRPHSLVLVAPAFGFTANWAQLIGDDGLERWRNDGAFPFYYYPQDQEIPLGVQFLESVIDLPFSQPP